MSPSLSHRTGSAVVWQALQLGGVKLIFLVRVIVLARLLLPEDFGLFAIALIALDFLLSITNFGMIPALVQRQDARREHYEAAWTIGLFRALAVGVAIALLAPWGAALFGEPEAATLLRVLALRPAIEATASMGVARLTRELRFGSLALLKLTGAAINAGVSIALVGPVGVWALVAGPLVGALVYAGLSYVVAPFRPRLRFGGAATGHLARYGRWVLVMAWTAVLGRMLLQMAISRQLGAAALGVYFMAGKLAFLPADISTQVVGSVAFPVFSRIQDDRRLAERTFRTVLLGLTVLMLPTSLLIFVLAPSLTADLLGDNWLPAVPVIRVLALANIAGILGDVVVPFLNGVGRPERSAAMGILQYATLTALAWILAGTYGVTGAAAAWIPAVAVTQLLGVVLVRRELERPFGGLGRPLAWIVGTSLAGAAVALGLDVWLQGAVGVIFAGIAGIGVTYALLGVADARARLGLSAQAVRLFPWAEPLLLRLGFGAALRRSGA